MGIDDTETLVARARAGDRAAFGELLERYRLRLARVIRSQLGAKLGRTADVDDILQDTCVQALAAIGRFEWRDEASFVHWLGTIAQNVIRQAARRVRGKPNVPIPTELAASGGSRGAHLRREERFDRLQEALDALDPDSRQVILLARLEGLPIREVARRLGRTPNATSVLLYRAAVKLKERFGDTESLRLPARRLVDREAKEGGPHG